MDMERPIARRNIKADASSSPCFVPAGDDTENHDSNNGKRGRRHRFLSFRYECLNFWKRTECSQQQAWKLLLLLVGIMGFMQVTRSVNFRTDDSGFFPLIEAPLVIRRVSGETIMKDASYKTHPRCMGVYFRDASSDSWFGVERLDRLHRTQMSHTTIELSKRDVKAQLHLENSRDYRHGRRDELESDNCKAQHEWQLKSYPTCNQLHEHALTLVLEKQVKLLGSGYWRDVWVVKDGANDEQALKTLRYEHDYEDRNYDRHRRDALAMERLTASDNIMDIYAYCGNSGIFEFATGGDMEDMIWYTDSDDKWNSTEKLIVAYQVATAIADVHDVEGNGRPSIAHTDITTSQFVHSDGKYKLNDFNRCRFIAWNKKTDKQCGFHVGNNPGNFRAPEEYKYELETEKIDVYSMGNVLYTLLTEKWPFDNAKSDDAQAKVKAGKRPHISSRIRESKDPSIVAIRKAIAMSWRQDPVERAPAREVATMLQEELKALGVKPEVQ